MIGWPSDSHPNCHGLWRMAAINTFAAFNSVSESWDSYIERFKCFLEANDLEDISGSRKRASFLTHCGPEMFAMAMGLLAPQTVHEVSWETLVTKLKGYYAPLPSRIACCHASTIGTKARAKL